MLRTSIIFWFLVLGMLTSSSFAQCSSQRSSTTRLHESVQRTGQQQTVSLNGTFTRQATTNDAIDTEIGNFQSEANEYAGIAILRPEEIERVDNGQLLHIAVNAENWTQGMGILSINGLAILIEPKQWTRDSVVLQLPKFLIHEAAQAKLFIAANPETLLVELEFQIDP